MEQQIAYNQLVVYCSPVYEPEVGRAIWMYDDSRQRTRALLNDIKPNAVDWVSPIEQVSIGALLYNLAATEMRALYDDILQTDMPDEVSTWFPHDLYDSAGELTVVRSITLDGHLFRLEKAHETFLNAFQGMPVGDFRNPRPGNGYTITPEWVLFHLSQYEGERRAQIAWLLKGYARQSTPPAMRDGRPVRVPA